MDSIPPNKILLLYSPQMSLFLFISSIPNLKSKKAGGCPGESESHYRSTPVKAFRVDRVWSLFTKVQRLADVQCRNFSVLWISSMTLFTLEYEGLSFPKFGRTIHFLFSFLFYIPIYERFKIWKKKKLLELQTPISRVPKDNDQF